MRPRWTGHVLALTTLAVALTVGPAQAQNRCGARKIAVASTAASCLLCLDARAAAKGPAADPAQAAKCLDPVAPQFAHIERKGTCRSTGDASLVSGAVSMLAGQVNAALDTDAANRCQAAKLKAACRKTACLAAAAARAVAKGTPVDQRKAGRCRSRFASSFAREEARGKCITSGDAAPIEALVDKFVDDLEQEVETTTTTSVPTSTTIAAECTDSDQCGITRCCHIPSGLCCRWGGETCAGTGPYNPFGTDGEASCTYDPQSGGPGPFNQDAICGTTAPSTCPVEAATPVYFECTRCADNGKPIGQLHNIQTGQYTSLY
jgi:hypothetical protein